jgi:transposase
MEALALLLPQIKTLSENFSMKVEQRRISPRMDLSIVTVLKGDAPYERGYHNNKSGLLPSSQTTVEETQQVPAQKQEEEQPGRQTESFRQSRRQCPNRYVLWTGCQWKALHRDWFGVSSSVVHERFQRWRRMGIFEKLMKRMAEYYARECGGIGWGWQAMDSKHCGRSFGRGENGQESHG